MLARLSTFFILALSLTACGSDNSGRSAQEADALSRVVAVAVDLQDGYEVTHEYTGVLAAPQHEDIGFELVGTISRVLVDEGEPVVAGQLLAELDTQLLETEREQLQAQVDEAQARVKLTQSNLAREQSLKRSGFAAEQRLDELRSEQQVLEATLERLRANLGAVDVRVQKSRLIAPYSGVITKRYRDTGAVLSAAAPVLRLLESGAAEARVGVPTRLLAILRPGDEATIACSDNVVIGRVTAVGAGLDPLTRTAIVRVGLPVALGLDGELVRLRLTEKVAESGAWLPISALTEGMRGLWVVYALAPIGDGSYRVETRDVNVLHAEREQVFVSGALSSGEQVVAAGLHRVVAGQTVGIADAGAT